MNKRGNILDWFIILAMLLFISITVFISFMIIDTVDSSSIFSENSDAQTAITNSKSALLSFDDLMLFTIIGLSVFVLVSSAVVYNHPAFFVAGVFLLFIAITVAGSISNTFWKFRTADNIAATAALFPKLTFLMEKLPFYILFMGIAATAVMYIAYTRQ